MPNSNDSSSFVFFVRLPFEVSNKIGVPVGGGTTLLMPSIMFSMSHSWVSSVSSTASIIVLKLSSGRLCIYFF